MLKVSLDYKCDEIRNMFDISIGLIEKFVEMMYKIIYMYYLCFLIKCNLRDL